MKTKLAEGLGMRRRAHANLIVLCGDAMLTYCLNLTSVVADVRSQLSATLPKGAAWPLCNPRSGDHALVKDLRQKSWSAIRWRGQFQVLLVTHTAVKAAERAILEHASHCKQVANGELARFFGRRIGVTCQLAPQRQRPRVDGELKRSTPT